MNNFAKTASTLEAVAEGNAVLKHIRFREDTQTFYLQTKHTAYVFCINELNEPEHLYYGASIPEEDIRHIRSRHGYSFAPYAERVGDTVSPSVYMREFPVSGVGDFRTCMLIIADGDGRYGARMQYVGHELRAGRLPIPQLPHSRGINAESLSVRLYNEKKKIAAILHYVVYPDCDAIVRYTQIVNESEREMRLLKVSSFCLDAETHDFDAVELFGTYQYERGVISRTPLHYGSMGQCSRKGASGHHGNPFFALCSHSACETHGDAYGFNLVYSGNYKNEIETDERGNTRIVSGISDEGFEYPLLPHESFYSPEAVLVYSSDGLGGMSRRMHDFARLEIINPIFVSKHRPIVLNTWEGCYFDVDENKLLAIADRAKEMGAELLVLDDGWFRSNDTEGLGDWRADGKRFPSGLKSLSEKLHAKGLGFGLWFEPEMVSKRSALYAAHPDWAVGNGDEQYLGRSQLVLDFSRPEVVDYVFSHMCATLDGLAIEYIKWDMNRYISEAGTAAGAQGAFFHRHMLGVYDLLHRITSRYPQVLLESCAGGGGRFDLGMLYYSPQIWTSDNTDPFNRIAIQLGTSLAYPNSCIASHVTKSVCSGLNADFAFRCATAAFGVYGYEMHPDESTKEERAQLSRYARDYIKNEELVLSGDLFRLERSHEFSAYMLVSKDKSRAVLTLVQLFYNPLDKTKVLRLQGLDRDAHYRCSLDGGVYSGAILERVGLRFDDLLSGTGRAFYVAFEKISI